MKKSLAFYAFLIIVILLTLYSISSTQSLSELLDVLLMADPVYTALAVLLMISFWCWDALIIKYLSQRAGIDSSLANCLRYAMVGSYYNQITPMASGGLPVQVWAMNARGPYGVSDASSILVNKWVVYQSMVTLYGAFFLVFNIPFVMSQSSGIYVWVFIGLLLNLIMMPAIWILAYNAAALLKVMKGIIAVLKWLRLLRWFSPERIEKGISSFVADLNRMQKDWQLIFSVAVMTFGQLTCYLGITYFVYRALGQSGLGFWDIIAIQSILYLAVHFIPTPGNAGASEGAFYILFKNFFPPQLIFAGLLLWRIIIYYFCLVITGMVAFYDHIILPRRYRDGRL